MSRKTKEICLLGAKEILLALAEIALPVLGSNRYYRSGLDKLSNRINSGQESLARRIYYLKKMGYIETFVENKEKYIEITPKGFEKIEKINDQNPSIP